MNQRSSSFVWPAVLAVASLMAFSGIGEAQAPPGTPSGDTRMVRTWTPEVGGFDSAWEVAPGTLLSLGSIGWLAWDRFGRAAQGFSAPRPMVSIAARDPRALRRTSR